MEIFDVYPLFNIVPVSACGSWITDDKGDKYLDMYGGHAVISIGHSHPHYLDRLKKQMDQIGFYSNSVVIPQQQELAEKLGNLSGYQQYQLFLCNSGAEANENALKLASFHTGRSKVVAFSGSFHGRTSAAVAATDDKKLSAPLNRSEHFVFCEWNNLSMLEDILQKNDCAAMIMEGIQGVGGVQVPDDAFLSQAAELCKKYGTLFICDEIQSGYGRTGKFFAHQHSGVRPDLITIAKGMGNGFPVAGVLIAPQIRPKHGMLGTTFGGAYLACAASLAVLEVMEASALIENATYMGNLLMEGASQLPGVKSVRGRGLMIGLELDVPLNEVRIGLLESCRVFTGASAQCNTLRILPSLNVSESECRTFLSALKLTLEKVSDNQLQPAS